MPNAKQNLVIVESPSKAKTIGKYLGPDYQVKASMGHLRDLAKSTLSVDIEHDFEPEYYPLKGKEEIISELQKAAKHADRVYLATDPDREGEAISWHLKYLLSIPDDATYRVTFNEITRGVVQESIQHPRPIDQNLVDAQQARRVLDRIVGYQLSPLLWRKIRKGLSAGRVQSVATRLVVDRENEIRAFQPQEYWTLDVNLSRVGKPGSFTAHYYGDPQKRELASEQDVQAVLDELQSGAFSVTGVKKSEKKRTPAPPFITSTLQQEASRKLNMTPRRTMMIAQQLYEGVEISGEGSVGLITYMRTDSLRISEEALAAAGSVIRSRYGDAYASVEPRRYKPKSSAQDAHEAIRPASIDLRPEDIKASLTRDQFNLYKLVYLRFIACQMADAVYETQQIEIANDSGVVLRSSAERLKFAGFTAVYEEGRDDGAQEEQIAGALEDVSEGSEAVVEETEATQHFTQAPPRYTEASLVRALEEKGIGRPSTYAPTISTILARGYVTREKKQLYPTELGVMITDMMKEHFTDIVDIAFTAGMEEQLDEVEEGKRGWRDVLRDFYGPFEKTLEKAEAEIEKVEIKDEVSDVVCDKCGAMMVYKFGRFGRFLACPNFPECRNTKAIQVEIAAPCPVCGGKLLEKTSRKGRKFYGCERYPECDFVSWEMPVEQKCPKCGGYMVLKRGRKGESYYLCANENCRERVAAPAGEEENE